MGEESTASALTDLTAVDGPSSGSGGDDRSLHTSKARQQSTKECEICQEIYQDDDVVRILPCGHYFHEHCILRYPSFPLISPWAPLSVPYRFLSLDPRGRHMRASAGGSKREAAKGSLSTARCAGAWCGSRRWGFSGPVLGFKGRAN